MSAPRQWPKPLQGVSVWRFAESQRSIANPQLSFNPAITLPQSRHQVQKTTDTKQNLAEVKTDA